jgi:hypothetical protein
MLLRKGERKDETKGGRKSDTEVGIINAIYTERRKIRKQNYTNAEATVQ